MILPIYLYGQPVLRKMTTDITPDYPGLKKLIEDMFETMDSAEGVGLAAPQVGLDIRVLVINLDPLSDTWPEYKNYRKAMINAHIIETEGDTISREEGCLSLPGIHESVVRQEKLKIRYCDENFVEHTEVFEGYVRGLSSTSMTISTGNCLSTISLPYANNLSNRNSIISFGEKHAAITG